MSSKLSTTCTMIMSSAGPDRYRLVEVLDQYLVALERGEPISPDELLARHPDIAVPLKECLSGLKMFHDGVLPPPPAVAINGDCSDQLLGDYRLGREVGRGGMGVVYEAEQLSLGRRVAIKMLPVAAAVDQKQISRFKNEAQAAAQVDHPNIVPVFAIGEQRGVYYFAMQFVNGKSLSQLLADLRGEQPDDPLVSDPPLPMADTRGWVNTVARMAVQVAEALHAAHEVGVVHRDVKPSNLLLDERGKVWVTDFGVARCKSGIGITQTGDWLGTLHYMSPEQAQGQTALVDHRSDIYSLGVTLYELATLRHPFDDVPASVMASESSRPTPRQLRYWSDSIPIDFQNIVFKAVAETRDDRYATAEDFAADLKRFLQGQPILARRPSLASRVGKWARRHHRSVTAAASALALCVVVAFGSLLMIAAERAKTVEAYETASSSHERAERKFRQAQQMLDQFGSRVAQRLADVPGAEAVRKELLAEMLPYYREFAREAADEAEVSADLAFTYSKLGYLSDQLYAVAEAEHAYREAQAILEQLVKTQPTNPEYSRNLALCCNNYGQLLQKRGDLAAAQQQLDRALAIQNLLVARWPGTVAYRADLATTHSNLGLLWSQSEQRQRAAEGYQTAIRIQEAILRAAPDDAANVGNLASSYNNLSALFANADADEARRCLQRAISLQLSLVRKDPERRVYRSDLALSYNNLGAILSRQGRRTEAEQCFSDAILIQQGLVTAAPAVVAYRRDLAVSYNNLGMSQTRAQAPDQAEQSFRQALAVQMQLVETHPNDASLLSGLGGVYNNLGMIYLDMADLTAAGDAFQMAIAAQLRAQAQAPDMLFVRESLNKHYYNYAQTLRSLGQPAEAASVVLQRRQLWPNDPTRLLGVAEELATTCQTIEVGDVRQRYVGEMMKTLQAARDAGLERLPDLHAPPFYGLADDFQFTHLEPGRPAGDVTATRHSVQAVQ